MKKNKLGYAFFLAVLMVMMFSMCISVQGSTGSNYDVGLTISYRDKETPIVGAQFHLYLVASSNEHGNLTVSDDFTQYNVDFQIENNTTWKSLASTLEGYVLRDNIQPVDSGETDDQGLLTFPSAQKTLTSGLYLVLGLRHKQNNCVYEAVPFIVILSCTEEADDKWDWGETVNVKYAVTEESHTVTRKVLKIWKDDGHENERPDEVIVQLMQDGKVYDTVVLNADNNWRHTWTGLDGDYQWTVAEKELDAYTVEVTREGVTFVVTNTYAEDIPDEPTPTIPPEPILPQTGLLWWPVPILFAVGMLFIVVGLMRRRGRE